MKTDAASVSGYLAALSPERRKELAKVRTVIKKALPTGYRETLQYGMITYVVPLSIYPECYLGKRDVPLPFVSLAAQKNHLALYLMNVYGDAKLERWFRSAWAKSRKKLDMGKSCLRHSFQPLFSRECAHDPLHVHGQREGRFVFLRFVHDLYPLGRRLHRAHRPKHIAPRGRALARGSWGFPSAGGSPRMQPMAKCFTTWTVLSHEPIEKHSDNLWSVSGKMPGGNQRRMSVARRSDGTLVLHNPIALDDGEVGELEAFGRPAFLVVPNGFHRMDSAIYKQRYPEMAVLCPEAARKKVSQVVAVSGHLDELPKDENVELFHLRGMKRREGALRVRSHGNSALVFNDTLLNMPTTGGVGGFFMGPTGTVSVPRFMRWMMMTSGAELKAHLQELAASPSLSHVVPGHGPVIAANAAATLGEALARL